MNDAHPLVCPDCGRPIPEGAPQGMCPKCLLSEAAAATVKDSEKPLEVPTIESIAAAFPALELIEPIGEGGMGIVYKARQRRLDRLVALKLLRCPPDEEGHFAERFLREARALAKLNHPNIITVYDFGESHGLYYLLMEYVDGVNLRQIMAGKKLSPEEALRIVPIVCQALQFAHEKGVLHRDIKPANILLTRDGVVKMADFGLAKFVGETSQEAPKLLTRTEASLGTPAYMAPEQTTDPSRVDHRADIYSLGVVFYEMLTGDLPLGRFPVPSSKSPVDERVDDVVMRTLEREPEERYQSAKDVQTDVEHLSDPGTAPRDHPDASPPSLPEDSTPPTPTPTPTRNPATTTSRSSQPEPESEPERRLSWKALFGTLLVLLTLPSVGFVGRYCYLLANQSIGRWEPLPTIYTFPPAIVVIFIIPGALGTLLGWAAAHDMRHRPDRFWGLGLTAFAALTWPFLLLAALVLFLGYMGRAQTDVLALILFLSPLLAIFIAVRFRRWLLNKESPKHWWWTYLVVIFIIPLYPAVREIVKKQNAKSFVLAAPRESYKRLKERLEDGANVDQRTERGETALMFTARDGDSTRAEFLIEHHADVDAKMLDGHTPLLIAARHGHLNVIRVLVEHGASVHETLRENGANALHLAAHNGYPNIVRYLVDHGLEPDSRNRHGETPLMLGAGHGHSGVIDQLISFRREAIVNLADDNGHTALDFAISRGHATIEKRLIGYGARHTASWWLRKAFVSGAFGWDTIIEHLQKTQAALETQPATSIKFGFNGWWYTFERPDLTLDAMLVEAGARGDRMDIAENAKTACLNKWPADTDRLTLYRRQDNPTHPRTFQSLDLQKRDVDHPIRSSQQDASLAGETRREGPTVVGIGSISSKTFFR